MNIKQRYNQPTPRKIKRIADAVLTGCAAFAGTSAALDYPKVGLVVALLGIIAKIASNYFTEKQIHGDN